MKGNFMIMILLSLSPGSLVLAQPDTINAVNHRLQLSNLREGKNVYLVYFTDSALNRKTSGDIWERTIHFETRGGQEVVSFNWVWLRGDSVLATILNICDRKTLAPVFHKAEYKKRGIFAYDFRENEMIADDTVANNQVPKNASVKLNIPVISWEEDLETYPLLPIRTIGQRFDIAFFDPNEKSPAYHRYEVIGKEALALNRDLKADCWLLKINYDKETYAIFWLTEKSKEVIKMKEYYQGSYRFKVRLY